MSGGLWDILICAIPHRHQRLCGLLAELDRQQLPGMSVLVYRDNLEHTIAEKRQALLEASGAEYTCFIDDDDMVPPWYAARIMQALQERPDYIGFRVKYLIDGEDQWLPAEHSLRHSGWWGSNAGLYRDISHLNPVRREVALAGKFDGGEYSEDSRWAAMVRDSGLARSEVFISADMYWYQYSTSDNAKVTARQPAREIPPLPVYPWLEAL